MPDQQAADGLAEIIGEVVGVAPDEIASDADLAALGVDSLAMIEVVIGVEQRFGVTIEDDDVHQIGTVSDLAAYLETHRT